MAISGNKPSEQRASKHFVGCENFKVICLNPTKAEYKDLLNIDINDDPQYVTENNGVKKVKLQLWLTNEDEKNPIRRKVDFWIEDRVKVSTGGRTEYCNGYGFFSYQDNPNDIKETQMFKNYKVRPALVGEKEFMSDLRLHINARYNANQQDECQLDDMQKLFNNDFTELKEIFKFYNNKIKYCIGVKQYTKDNEIKYQDVIYNKTVDYAWKDNSKILQDIKNNKANGGSKGIYYGEDNDCNLMEIDPKNHPFFQADNPSALMGASVNTGGDLPF